MRSMLAIWLGVGLASPAWALSPPPKPPVAQTPRPPADAPASDKQAFAEAEAALERFEAMNLDLPESATLAEWAQHLQGRLTEMAQALGDLQARYTRLGNSADPAYAVPALVRAGEVMERFAAEVEGMPMPTKAPPDTIKALRGALSQAADATRTTARTFYERAVRRAEAADLKGEWVDFARASSKRLPAPGEARGGLTEPKTR